MSKKYLQMMVLVGIGLGVIGGTGSFAEYCPGTKGNDKADCCFTLFTSCHKGCKSYPKESDQLKCRKQCGTATKSCYDEI